MIRLRDFTWALWCYSHAQPQLSVHTSIQDDTELHWEQSHTSFISKKLRRASGIMGMPPDWRQYLNNSIEQYVMLVLFVLYLWKCSFSENVLLHIPLHTFTARAAAFYWITWGCPALPKGTAVIVGEGDPWHWNRQQLQVEGKVWYK